MSVGAPAYRQLPAVAFNCFSLYRLDINKPRRFPETKKGGQDCLLDLNRCVWGSAHTHRTRKVFLRLLVFCGRREEFVVYLPHTRGDAPPVTLLDRTARVDQEQPQTVLKRLVDPSALKRSCHGDSSFFSRRGKFRNISTDRGRESWFRNILPLLLIFTFSA